MLGSPEKSEAPAPRETESYKVLGWAWASWGVVRVKAAPIQDWLVHPVQKEWKSFQDVIREPASETNCLNLDVQLLDNKGAADRDLVLLNLDSRKPLVSKEGSAVAGAQGAIEVLSDEKLERRYVVKVAKMGQEQSLFRELWLSKQFPPSYLVMRPLVLAKSASAPPVPLLVVPRACESFLQVYNKGFSEPAYHLDGLARKCILYQLILGVHLMHTCGFFHKDIKPENILCTRWNQHNLWVVQLTDLGLAALVPALPNMINKFSGSFLYGLVFPTTAPVPNYWVWRADSWSLVTLVYLLYFKGSRDLTFGVPTPLPSKAPEEKQVEAWRKWSTAVLAAIQRDPATLWPATLDPEAQELVDWLLQRQNFQAAEHSVLGALALRFFDTVRESESPLAKLLVEQTPSILRVSHFRDVASHITAWEVHHIWLQDAAKGQVRGAHIASALDEKSDLSERWKLFQVSLLSEKRPVVTPSSKAAKKAKRQARNPEHYCIATALGYQLCVTLKPEYKVNWQLVRSLLCSTLTSLCATGGEGTTASPSPPADLYDIGAKCPALHLISATAFRLLAIEHRWRPELGDLALGPQFLAVWFSQCLILQALDQRFVAGLLRCSSTLGFEAAWAQMATDEFADYKTYQAEVHKALKGQKELLRFPAYAVGISLTEQAGLPGPLEKWLAGEPFELPVKPTS